MSAPGKRTAADAGLDIERLISEGTSKKGNVTGNVSREMQGGGADGKKHSLDSDEELDDPAEMNKDERLHDDDIEGQEEFTLEREGEIQITPFNLQEEQEEGHFAKDGNFVWKKEKEVLQCWVYFGVGVKYSIPELWPIYTTTNAYVSL